MKKLTFTIVMFLAFVAANAQTELTFKRFKFDISAGYSYIIKHSGSGTNNGFLLSFEPKYALNDIVTLGLKAETSISVSADDEVKGSGSYLATGDFYFTTNTVRPFAGAGVGVFTHASAQVGSSNSDIEGYSRFGFAPRLGVEIAHFRAAVEYNFAGTVANVSQNYVGFKLGVLIGGGRIAE